MKQQMYCSQLKLVICRWKENALLSKSGLLSQAKIMWNFVKTGLILFHWQCIGYTAYQCMPYYVRLTIFYHLSLVVRFADRKSLLNSIQLKTSLYTIL